jgi:hypothetical protein
LITYWNGISFTKNKKEILIFNKKDYNKNVKKAVDVGGGLFTTIVNQITEGNFVIEKNDTELYYDGVEFVPLDKSQIYTSPVIAEFVYNMLKLKDKITDIRIVQL